MLLRTDDLEQVKILNQHLLEHLQKFQTSPFLFVGSGLSRRYLSIEDWEGVLQRFSRLTDKPYAYYRATANSELPRIASIIAQNLHELWWNDDKFAESRSSFSHLSTSIDSSLKIEISEYMNLMTDNVTDDSELLLELKLLREAVVDGVITTNWDRLLESVFPEFRVYIGQEELLFADHQAIGEIYKIHGCSSQPNSLILTERDYGKFDERNPYLASKLLTTFVEHPVIFLGYSMSDQNIETILRSIATCLTKENLPQLQDRLIFVHWRPYKEEDSFQRSQITTGGFTIPVVRIETPTFVPVFQTLTRLRRKFPASLLRRLKKHVYQLILNNDPNGNLFVQEFEDESRNVDVVFGIGAISKLGYQTLNRRQLLEDVLFDNGKFHARSVVQYRLPELLKATPIVPVFKYLREAGYFEPYKENEIQELPFKIKNAIKAAEQCALPPPSAMPTLSRDMETHKPTFEELCLQYDRYKALQRIALLPPEEIPKDKLCSYLIDNIELMESGAVAEQTQYFKNVCLYDYLKYGPRKLS